MSWQYSCYEIGFIWRSGARRWGAALDNKSLGQITVWIQVPPPPIKNSKQLFDISLIPYLKPSCHVMVSCHPARGGGLFSSPCQRAAQSRLRFSVRLMNTMRCRAEIIVKPDVQVFFFSLSPPTPQLPAAQAPPPPEASTPLSHPLHFRDSAQRSPCVTHVSAPLTRASQRQWKFLLLSSQWVPTLWVAVEKKKYPPHTHTPLTHAAETVWVEKLKKKTKKSFVKEDLGRETGF